MNNFSNSCIYVVLALSGRACYGQSDAEKFAEGRIAFDQYHDCKAAKEALESVSDATRNNPIWLIYIAETNMCLGLTAEALRDYEVYDKLVPGQTDIINTIGRLRYELRKQQETQRAKEDANDRVRSDLRRRTQVRDAARQTLSSDSRALLSLLKRYPPSHDGANNRVRAYQVSALSECTFRVEFKWGTAHSLDIVDFSLADAQRINVGPADRGDLRHSVEGGQVTVACLPNSEGRGCAQVERVDLLSGTSYADDYQFRFQTLSGAQEAAELMKTVITACVDPSAIVSQAR